MQDTETEACDLEVDYFTFFFYPTSFFLWGLTRLQALLCTFITTCVKLVC